jgi:hypothetical protein
MKIELSHDALSQLLPWYANGTLSAEEHAAVEQHLNSCAACRGELRWLREVSAATIDLAEEAPPMEPSFSKALAAVDKWEQSKSRSAFGPIARWFSAIWNPPAQLARYAMAAQFALIVGLCVVLWFSHREAKTTYTTLSGSESSTSGGVKLTVSFAPNTTVDEISRILSEIGGNIVGGPSANGICIVQLPAGASKDAEVQATIDTLRQDKSIRFVERLP